MQYAAKHLSERGLRVTDARVALLEILTVSPEPMTAPSLHAALILHGVSANKSTVYRDLDRFVEEELVDELDFGEGQKRYERTTTPHHHAVCTECNRIAHIELPSHLATEEAFLMARYGFRVDSHALEFFGTCADCQR